MLLNSIDYQFYRLSEHYRFTKSRIDRDRINAQSQLYSYFVRINHSIYTKSSYKYPHAKRTFVYRVHSRFLRAHFAHSASFNICSPLIDFTSRRNRTYFYCCHHCALRFLRRYIPDIYLVSTLLYLRIVWCFSAGLYSGDIINLPHSRRSISVAFPSSRGCRESSRRRLSSRYRPYLLANLALMRAFFSYVLFYSRKHVRDKSTILSDI